MRAAIGGGVGVGGECWLKRWSCDDADAGLSSCLCVRDELVRHCCRLKALADFDLELADK